VCAPWGLCITAQWAEPQHAGLGPAAPTLQLLGATTPSKHPLTPSKPTKPLTVHPEVSTINSHSGMCTHMGSCGPKCARAHPTTGGMPNTKRLIDQSFPVRSEVS